MAARRAIALGFSIGATYVTVNERRRESFLLATTVTAPRVLRACYTAGVVWVSYKLGDLPRAEAEHGVDSPQSAEVRSRIHKAVAERVLALCRLHGGLYTKIGQFVSASQAIPVEYSSTLSALTDRATPHPWGSVRRVLEQEAARCGRPPPSEQFSSIDEIPVAAASLAQVHRGVTLDGQEVAIKVQYPELAHLMDADLATFSLLFSALELAFPAVGPLAWLLPEFESTTREELDFTLEARNQSEASAFFAASPSVHVPAVRFDLSSSRVLTMEWVNGVKLNDPQGMGRLADTCGVPLPSLKRTLARTLSTAFADTIFTLGLVHMDPHVGNVLVRANASPGGGAPTPQLVILDFGMVRHLTPTFRLAHAKLWQALLTRDAPGGLAAVAAMGLQPEDYEGLSLLLTYRRPTATTPLGGRWTAADAAAIKAKYKDAGPRDVNAFMQRLPKDLLHTTRCLALVRSNNKELGGTTRDRLTLFGEAALQGLLAHGGELFPPVASSEGCCIAPLKLPPRAARGWGEGLAVQWSVLHFRWSLFWLDAAVRAAEVLGWAPVLNEDPARPHREVG